MINFLKSLLGSAPEPDYAELVNSGALIVDVRTAREYASGHIKGSVNIPVDKISPTHKELKDKNRAVITCCASGSRSAAAARMLKSSGYESVHNGGPWHHLQRKILN